VREAAALMREDAVMRILARIFRQADAVGRPLLHAFEDEVDTVRVAPRHPMEPRQHVVLLAHPLLGPLDRDRMIARIGFHPALIVVGPLAQHLLADLGDADDVAEEVHHQLGSRQRRQIAVNDNAIKAVIDEDQELAEQLGEDVHRFAPRNGRSKPDRAKLCATALGFDSPTRFAPSSDGPQLMTDASSPPTSLSCSRPKQAMLGSSTPPIARDGDPEPTALEETDTSFQIAWPGSYRLDGPAFVYTDRHSRRVSTILGYPTQLLAKDLKFQNIFG